MAKKIDVEALKRMTRAAGIPFHVSKIGHIVLNCSDIERSTRFYTEVLGFSVSDVYPEDMAKGGMVFMRFHHDHHGIGLVGTMPGQSGSIELNHLAFEVKTLDEVLLARDHLKKHGIAIDFEGRRRAGSQIAVEFRDPDGHRLEIFWGVDQVGSEGRTRPPAEWKWALSLREAILDPCQGQDTTLLNPALIDKETPEEAARIRERTLKTQAAKLGH
ncbi:MAG TPA: VOC family protein [Stellaceae bacterium]|nr:VOC family protein [Stellaceae bacterium]